MNLERLFEEVLKESEWICAGCGRKISGTDGLANIDGELYCERCKYEILDEKYEEINSSNVNSPQCAYCGGHKRRLFTNYDGALVCNECECESVRRCGNKKWEPFYTSGPYGTDDDEEYKWAVDPWGRRFRRR